MRAKNIVEVTDFTPAEWKRLIGETVKFKKNRHRQPKALKNKRIGLMFDSNSLRTKISFETACYLLGGDSYFIDIHNVTHEKDGVKRETFEDIIDTLDRMVDAYVVRDYSRQMLDVLKRKTNPPFINGFCEIGHPSQALADMAVIKWKKGTVQGLNYAGVCPEAGSGVLESFIYAVLLLGERITIITPSGKLKGKNKDFGATAARLSEKYGGSLRVTNEIKETVIGADVLYADEWWENTKNFLRKKMGRYRVDDHFLAGSKPNLSILHCLPAHPGREITEAVMRGPQSLIFDEAEFRVYSAMSLLSYLAAGR
ncbi:MAG: Ornithine carbamoyltransferase, catabolic [Candidatus Magasanikbacteria bacterium GW2011_GWA2_56_11]|uniref:Ornithine carbamoyltransferase, catabolic n=1 Tax=Candidatus Magasanikbacteria bacterium GW2011_GWA2_56_11 TaxID=1619044 RepID=A0A0G1YE34_9BACT|nr:MAG: Ornithine carbamoyltransferase, catabolic [Candidatus Magasanikbacteria bacterium GW2011_GWA2_56_11]